MAKHSDYVIKTAANVRDDICANVRNTLEGVRAETPGDDIYDQATGHAAALAEAYAHLRLATDEAFPDTAAFDNLVRHARRHIGDPLAATKAIGAFAATGTIGATWSLGDTFIHVASGQRYQATADGELLDDGAGNGVGSVPVEAMTGGDVGALIADEDVLWEGPPPGVFPSATVAADMTGGTDAESPEHYLDRYHAEIDNPTAGGTAADFEKWALKTTGVGMAVAFPNRRELGTCDVGVLDMEGDNVTTAVLGATQTNLDANRPVTASGDPAFDPSLAVHPVLTDVDLTFGLHLAAGYNFSDVPTQTIQAGSSSQTIKVTDAAAYTVGAWVATRDLRQARKILSLDAGNNTITLEAAFLDSLGRPASPAADDLCLPGCSTYDTLAASIASHFATIQIGATYYESKGRGALTNNFECLDAKQTPTGDVVAIVNADKIEALRLGELILQAAS